MKKYFKVITLLLVVLPNLFMFSACNKHTPELENLSVSIKNNVYEMTNNIITLEYGRNVAITKDMISVVANYNDSSTETVTNFEFISNIPEDIITPVDNYMIEINYKNKIATIAINVIKATIDMSNVGWSDSNFVYDGTEKSVAITNLPEGVTVSYQGENATNAGTYTATAIFETNSNYNAIPNKTITWTISPAELTISANNHTITYGDNASNNGYIISGFVNGETEDVLQGSIAYNYNGYDTTSSVGNYDITLNGVTANDYNISFIKGVLTVNPKEIDLCVISWPSENEYIYTGSPIKPELINVPEHVKVVYSYSNPNPVDVANYSVTATITAENNNYTLLHNTIGSFTYSIIANPDEDEGNDEAPTNPIPAENYISITIAGNSLDVLDYDGSSYIVRFDNINISEVEDGGLVSIEPISTDLENIVVYNQGEQLDITNTMLIAIEYDETYKDVCILCVNLNGVEFNIIIAFADSVN